MSRKLRDLARGRNCEVCIPGVCNFNPETVVLAHLGGAGMGMKRNDLHGAYACSACHDAIDGRTKPSDPMTGERYPKLQLDYWHMQGVIATQEILIKEGVVKA